MLIYSRRVLYSMNSNSSGMRNIEPGIRTPAPQNIKRNDLIEYSPIHSINELILDN
jgi:hypothetical protein